MSSSVATGHQGGRFQFMKNSNSEQRQPLGQGGVWSAGTIEKTTLGNKNKKKLNPQGQSATLVQLGQVRQNPFNPNHIPIPTGVKRKRNLSDINRKYNNYDSQTGIAKILRDTYVTFNPCICVQRTCCARAAKLRALTTRDWCKFIGVVEMGLGAIGGLTSVIINYAVGIIYTTRFYYAVNWMGICMYLLMLSGGFILLLATKHGSYKEASYWSLGNGFIMLCVGVLCMILTGFLVSYPIIPLINALAAYMCFQGLFCFYWSICALALFLDFKAGVCALEDQEKMMGQGGEHHGIMKTKPNLPNTPSKNASTGSKTGSNRPPNSKGSTTPTPTPPPPGNAPPTARTFSRSSTAHHVRFTKPTSRQNSVSYGQTGPSKIIESDKSILDTMAKLSKQSNIRSPPGSPRGSASPRNSPRSSQDSKAWKRQLN